MDPLTLILETVVIPSFTVGALLVVMLAVFQGKPGAIVSGFTQSFAMALGFVAGIVGVLDRVPYPPSDVQGRLLVGVTVLCVLGALGASWSRKVGLLIPLAVAAILALSWWVLPASLELPTVIVAMVAAGLALGLLGYGLLPRPITNQDETAAVAPPEPSTDFDVLLNPVESDILPTSVTVRTLPEPWIGGLFLLLFGSIVSGVLLLGGSASSGQIAGVVCSVTGPAVVFGLYRRAWGLQPIPILLSASVLITLLAVGNRLSNVPLSSAILVACSPLGFVFGRFLGWEVNRRTFWMTGYGIAIALLGAAIAVSVGSQPEKESW